MTAYLSSAWLITWLRKTYPDEAATSEDPLQFSQLWRSFATSTVSIAIGLRNNRMRNFEFSDSAGRKLLYLLCCLLNTGMILIITVSVNTAIVQVFQTVILAGFSLSVLVLLFLIFFIFLIMKTTFLMTHLSPPPSRLYPDITCSESADFCAIMAGQAVLIAVGNLVAFICNCFYLTISPLHDPLSRFQQRMAVLAATGQSAPHPNQAHDLRPGQHYGHQHWAPRHELHDLEKHNINNDFSQY